MYLATIANSANNLYTRNRSFLAQDIHNVMIAVSTVHAMVIDGIDTITFLNELWEENTENINEWLQGYTAPVIAFIQGIVSYLLADRTTVKIASQEVLEEIEGDRQESISQAKIAAITVSGFFQAFVIEVKMTVSKTLDEVKLQAKELGIKGWNFYKSIEKLEAKIAEVKEHQG